MDIEKLKALKAEYVGALREHAREGIMSLLRRLFEEYPDLLTVEWRQYTPYFNDGEPCEFRVYGFEVRWTDMPGGDDSVKEWWLDRSFTEPSYLPPAHLRAAVRELDAVPSDIYEAAFGDHAEVFASREGVTVEEYDHHN